MPYELITGDCLAVMAEMEPNSVDAIVTDPPYGLRFMGKDWDHGVPGVQFWQAALRVAKPGAHMLAFGGTRTFHRLAVAIEDAGWEIRDVVMWVHSQGFPKSLDVSKAIDKAAGAERKVVGRKNPHLDGGKRTRYTAGTGVDYGNYASVAMQDGMIPVTAPATDDAAQWDGWGTALKPAWEPIIVARKPLDGTVAANVLEWGTGAINIDGCRVGTAEDLNPTDYDDSRRTAPKFSGKYNNGKDGQYRARTGAVPPGRWPANLIHDGSAEVLAGFPVTTQNGYRKNPSRVDLTDAVVHYSGDAIRGERGHNDTGSAARFFYCAKASKADRDEGCEGLEEQDGSVGDRRPSGNMTQRLKVDMVVKDTLRRNHHPCVKPTALMRYLVRLVTPPGGVVLDPFMGSGSTGKATALEGFGFIGIDTDPEYVEIARRRIAAVELPLLVTNEDGG